MNLHVETVIFKSSDDVAKRPWNVLILILVVLLTKLIGILNVPSGFEHFFRYKNTLPNSDD